MNALEFLKQYQVKMSKNGKDWLVTYEDVIAMLMKHFHESETKSLIEQHKIELEEKRAEGYNLGVEHGQHLPRL